MNIKKYIKEELYKSKLLLLGILVVAIIQVRLSLLQPTYMRKYLDNVMITKDVTQMYGLILMYVGIGILIYCVTILVKYLSENFGFLISNNLRVVILDKILSYDQNFFNGKSNGQLLQYIENDVSTIKVFLANKLVDIVINIILTVGIIIIFFESSIYIGLFFSLYIAVSIYIIVKTITINNDAVYQSKETVTNNNGKYSEYINAKKDIETLGEVDYIANKLDDVYENTLPIQINIQKYFYRIWATTSLLVVIANVLALFGGGNLYFGEIISIGTVYLLYSYSNMLKSPFESLHAQLQCFMDAKSSIDRLNKLLNYKEEVTDGDNAIEVSTPNVKFENVTYHYENADNNALENINIEIEPKQTVGIMGVSGSGKSTFCKIICKLIEPTKGLVYIGDTDITTISVENLRKDVAYISTTASMFKATLKDNITLFDGSISDEEVVEILEEFCILKYFEDGSDFLNKVIDDSMLSSGQKQLISLSRILFKDKKLIVFDEASSRLDSAIENDFHNVFNIVTKDITTIIVSHEVNTLKYCDKIVIFENAKIVENDYKYRLEQDVNSRYNQIINSKEGVL